MIYWGRSQRGKGEHIGFSATELEMALEVLDLVEQNERCGPDFSLLVTLAGYEVTKQGRLLQLGAEKKPQVGAWGGYKQEDLEFHRRWEQGRRVVCTDAPL